MTVAEQTTALNGVINSFSSAAPEAAEAFIKLNKALGNSADPMTIATLRAKGLTGVLEALSKLSPDDLGAIFKETRAGRGITILVAKMKEYKDALAQARAGGNLADTSFQKMLATLSHLGDKLLVIGKNLAVQFGEVLLGSLTKAANALIDVGKLISEFIKNNPTLVLTLAKVAGAILLAGGAFVSLGLAFSVASTVLSGFVAVGSLIVDAVVAVGSALAGLFLFFTSGTGVIVLAIAAISSIFIDFGAIFASVSSSVKNSLKSMSDTFASFKNGIVSTFDLVKRAIAAKDYDLAVRIVVTKIKSIWFEAVEGIKKKYDELKNSFMEKFTAIGLFFKDFVNGMLTKLGELTSLSVFSGLKDLFNDTFQNMDGTLEGFSQTWSRVWTLMKQTAFTVFGVVERGFLNIAQGAVKTFATLANISPQGVAHFIRTGGDPLININDEARADRTQERERLEGLQNKRARLAFDATKHLTSPSEALKDDFGEKQESFKQRILSLDKQIEQSELKIGSNEQRAVDAELNAWDEKIKKSQEFNSINNEQLQSELETEILRKESEKQLRIKKELAAKEEALKLENLKRITLENEKATQEFELKVAEFKKASIELFNPVKEALEGALNSILNPKGDAIVPNDKKDQNLPAKEEKTIRDGILGAFNTNALGDFSKGDVMKSIADLQKETNEKLEEMKKLQEQSLVPAKETANNTKNKALFK